MFKNLILLLFISSLIFSCKPTKDDDIPVPSDIIDEARFTKILTDFYLCEGAMGLNIKGATNVQFDSVYRFNPLKDNHISRGLFDSSLTYYSSHPKKLKKIQDDVLENLSQIFAEGKLNGSKKKKKKIEPAVDSLSTKPN